MLIGDEVIPATLVVGLGVTNSTSDLAGVWNLRENVPESCFADGGFFLGV